MNNQQKCNHLISILKQWAEQKTCYERKNDNNYYENTIDGRENDNFYPPYPSDAFNDGEEYGKINFARSLLSIFDN